MGRFDPKLFIGAGLLSATVGFLLLDGDEMSSRPGVEEIISGSLIVGGISYRFVLLLSVLAVTVGAYRSWARRKV